MRIWNECVWYRSFLLVVVGRSGTISGGSRVAGTTAGFVGRADLAGALAVASLFSLSLSRTGDEFVFGTIGFGVGSGRRILSVILRGQAPWLADGTAVLPELTDVLVDELFGGVLSCAAVASDIESGCRTT